MCFDGAAESDFNVLLISSIFLWDNVRPLFITSKTILSLNSYISEDCQSAIQILFIPLMLLMWIAIKIGSLMTYISGLALGIISGIIAVISIVYMLTGAGMNGFIGLVIAYLISPYGIPMFMIMLLE